MRNRMAWIFNLTATVKDKTMTRQLFIFILATLIFLIGLTSCSSVFTLLYGMKKTKTVDQKTIVRYAKKYNIPEVDNYGLDTAYFSHLISLDSNKYKTQIKNHYQPLQALYYDNSGHLKSFQVNCYASGFPNLKWDRNEIMTTFPPKERAPVDSLVSVETQLKYLKPLTQTSKFSVDNYDWIVIVYWSRFMGRQSKRLIHFVQNNGKLEKEKKVKIIYVNTDNIFAAQ